MYIAIGIYMSKNIGKYKSTHSFEQRVKEVEAIRKRFPDKIPVIIEGELKSGKVLEKSKFLVPCDFSFGHLQQVIRKNLKTSSGTGLFFAIGQNMPSGTIYLSTLYEQNKEKCGYLFVTFHEENVFG
jgi:GABA(A) receptor-associated protein